MWLTTSYTWVVALCVTSLIVLLPLAFLCILPLPAVACIALPLIHDRTCLIHGSLGLGVPLAGCGWASLC